MRMTPVKYVAQVKKESSKFVKTLGTHYRQFYWQGGDLTFQDEYGAILRHVATIRHRMLRTVRRGLTAVRTGG